MNWRIKSFHRPEEKNKGIEKTGQEEIKIPFCQLEKPTVNITSIIQNSKVNVEHFLRNGCTCETLGYTNKILSTGMKIQN